eukprot:CAMPEP_0185557302 /NCGR_PEP_ID=MMETSP1381-20130426/49423_1 /TAXON_ID=298111 /ORGANISM="Pavlova sp., Strain CCMP459" /LENGTH=178 /DNA_ID=CAMNT_0028170741 /DNA_START=97 /DNA_END=630 /DNA_ORIENTATION=-
MGRRRPAPPAEVERPAAPIARVLCLHGYTSNGIIFESKLRGLLRATDLAGTFPTGPHAAHASWIEEAASELGIRGEARSWFVDDGDAGDDDGWGASRLALLEAGPWDGIIAFSQGCQAALRLVAGPDAPTAARACRFLVLCSSPDLTTMAGWVHAVQSPSLHVIGAADGVVPPADSRA